jgi:hypothetical protein
MARRKKPKSKIDAQWIKFQAAFSRSNTQDSFSVKLTLAVGVVAVLALVIWILG